MRVLILIALLVAGAAQADWKVIKNTNDMTGETSTFATSQFADTVRPMPFPYTGTKARIIASCIGGHITTYLHFTTAPNVSNAETESGYNVVPVRMRFDEGEVRTAEFMQDWGDAFLIPYDFHPEELTNGVLRSNVLRVSLNWHGANHPVWAISLTGSTKAINQARAVCGR